MKALKYFHGSPLGGLLPRRPPFFYKDTVVIVPNGTTADASMYSLGLYGQTVTPDLQNEPGQGILKQRKNP